MTYGEGAYSGGTDKSSKSCSGLSSGVRSSVVSKANDEQCLGDCLQAKWVLAFGK